MITIYPRKSQPSDNMEVGRVREAKRKGRKISERSSEKRTSQKTEDAGARKGSKVAKHLVFPMAIYGSGGSKSLKRRVRSHLAR